MLIDVAPGPGLHVVRATGLEPLVDTFAALLAGPRADPFAGAVVSVPSAGVQRWVAQRLSGVLGAEGHGDGICAGIEFPTLPRLLADLGDEVSGTHRGEDPWRVGHLQWVVLDSIEQLDGVGWAHHLTRHVLGASTPGARLAAARRIAGLFRRYADDRPGMLEAWADGADVGPDGAVLGDVDGWQPRLWRTVRDQVGTDPVERRRAVVAALREGPAGSLPERVMVLTPPRLSAGSRELVEALASTRAVVVGLVDHSPHSAPQAGGGAADHRLVARLGTEARTARDGWLSMATSSTLVAGTGGPDTLLGRLQHAVTEPDTDAPEERPAARADGSLQFHASHGPDRQVEVLRDVLLGLLDDDPSLEPRDIAVLCPQLEVMGPLLEAAFAPADISANPGHRIRVRISDPDLRTSNPVLGALAAVLDLASGRLEATGVLDLLRLAPVAARFGLTDEDQARLRELVDNAGIRWGLDARHRAEFGMGAFEQNTWEAGLARLVAGVAMDETELVPVGGVLPFDDIGTNDVARVGVLAEVTERLRLVTEAGHHERSAGEWVELLRDTLAALTDARGDDAWQLTHAATGLADLADEFDGVTTRVSLGDVRVMLDRLLAGQSPRAGFGTGSLVVTSPEQLRHVPHEVVVCLGFDDGVFPRAQHVDGDDLAARVPLPQDPDSRAADRQFFLDALMAARRRVVVISSRHNPVSNEPVPLAIPLAEIIDAVEVAEDLPGGAARALTIEHPLQPFSAAAFRAPVRGYDQAAFAGARVLTEGSPAPHVRYPRVRLPEPPERPDVLELRELESILIHPVRALLRQRGGLPTWEADEDADADQIPADLNGLDKWRIGDRMMGRALQGADVDQLVAAELLRGELPPGSRGRGELTRVANKVVTIRDGFPGGVTPVHHQVDLDVRGRTLRGIVTTWGDEVCEPTFSQANGRSFLVGWLQLLALAAAEPGRPWRWRLIGATADEVLAAPSARWSDFYLHDLISMADLALVEPLPFMPKFSWEYAKQRRNGLEGHDLWSALNKDRYRGSGPAFLTETDPAFRRFYPSLDSLRAEAPRPDDHWNGLEESRFGTFARRVFAPIQEYRRTA